MAENVAESLGNGMRVVLVGNLVQRSYEKDGEKRTGFEVQVEEIAPSLKSATALVTKKNKLDPKPAGQSSGQSYPTFEEPPF